MKKHPKKICSLLLVSALSFSIFANTFGMMNVSAASMSEDTCSDTEISPRKPNIGWRFKMENGRLYKRLYNYSTEQWIGDWIAVN